MYLKGGSKKILFYKTSKGRDNKYYLNKNLLFVFVFHFHKYLFMV